MSKSGPSTFYAVVTVEKSECVVFGESGIRMLMEKAKSYDFGFGEDVVQASLLDYVCVITGEEYFTYVVRVGFEETPEASDFEFFNDDGCQIGSGWLVTNCDEFEKAKNLIEERIDYTRDELAGVEEKCANGEIEQTTVDAERRSLKRLESMLSTFVENKGCI